jgi:pimeloyl-ACP methyl ester carboxylesterase
MTVATVGGVANKFAAAQVASPENKKVQTDVLDIGYEEHGSSNGFPVILLHGFPYDVRSFDGVSTPLAEAGYRVLLPYLRGYGNQLQPEASIRHQRNEHHMEIREVGLPGSHWTTHALRNRCLGHLFALFYSLEKRPGRRQIYLQHHLRWQLSYPRA